MTTYLQLVPRLRMRGAIPLFLPHVFRARRGKNFTYFIYEILNYLFQRL